MDGRNYTAKVAGGLALMGLALSGCLRTEEFPTEPVIVFKSFAHYGDSSSITISFTDGDGDIGLDQGDTLAPYNPASLWFHNFFVDIYKKQSGAWVEQELAIPYYYRVPNLTPAGQNKALEGDIAVALNQVFFGLAETGDTMRFEVRLADRALHMSNRVSSEAVIVP